MRERGSRNSRLPWPGWLRLRRPHPSPRAGWVERGYKEWRWRKRTSESPASGAGRGAAARKEDEPERKKRRDRTRQQNCVAGDGMWTANGPKRKLNSARRRISGRRWRQRAYGSIGRLQPDWAQQLEALGASGS